MKIDCDSFLPRLVKRDPVNTSKDINAPRFAAQHKDLVGNGQLKRRWSQFSEAKSAQRRMQLRSVFGRCRHKNIEILVSLASTW